MVLLRVKFFKDFQEKMCYKAKSKMFAFGHLNLFLLLKAKYQSQIVERLKFKRHPPEAFNSQEHFYINVEPHGKLTCLGVKVDEPKST